VITLKKQPNNTGSMKTTTVPSLLRLLSALIIFAALSGGASYAAERQKYKIIVTRPDTDVTTQLRVYAENEEEARENVALNGWQILSIELYQPPTAVSGEMRGLTPTSDGEYSITITKVGEGSVKPYGTTNVPANGSLMIEMTPDPCEKLGSLIYNGQKLTPEGNSHTIENIEKEGSVVVVFEANGTECADNGILSANLNEQGAIYFALGEFRKELTDKEINIISNANNAKKYVIIGHTDDVRVVPNTEYADNFELSAKRAAFFLNKLTEAGIPAENVQTLGLGPAFPAAPNKKNGQPLNRRAILYERIR